MEKIIIAGNGIAGHSALQELLKSPQTFDITVIWQEVPTTYMRTQIIDYAVGELAENKFFMIREDFHAANNVRSIQGEVVSIDDAARRVKLRSGEELPFDRLILATGASNFVPPVAVCGNAGCETIDSGNIKGQSGVITLRDLDDARSFGQLIRTARRALVVGGGLLGLEAADTLLRHGLEVTVVEFAARLLPRQLDTASSHLFRDQVERSGIKFLLGDSVATLRYADGVLQGVDLVSGRSLDCDLILFSIGIRSNLAEFGRTVEVNRGITINKYTETSEPGIYACGDAAEYKGLVYGTWGFAMASGKAAGQNAAGNRVEMKPYILNTMFNALGTKIFSTGSINFDDPTLQSFVSGHPDDGYVRLLFSGSELVGGVLIGDTSKGPKLSRAIDDRMSYQDAVAAFSRLPQPEEAGIA